LLHRDRALSARGVREADPSALMPAAAMAGNRRTRPAGTARAFPAIVDRL
jgi:hypothetical protein